MFWKCYHLLVQCILSSVFFQLTQTNPPEFMGSTLKELGIGTYQNVAVVGGHTNFILIYCHRPIRLTQCCTQFKSPRVKILHVLYLHYNVAFTFK